MLILKLIPSLTPQLLFLCHCLIRGHVDFEGQSCIHTLAKLRSSDFKHLNLNDTFPDKVLEFDQNKLIFGELSHLNSDHIYGFSVAGWALNKRSR